MESLDFDKLITSYYENLNTKLRHFYAGPAFLDSWVHDENLNRSLLGVFESAHDNGVQELSIELSETLSNKVDFPLLQKELNGLGNPKVEQTSQGFRVSIRQIHPAYRKALSKREKNICFEGFPHPLLSAGLSAKVGQLELSCHINSSNLIEEARHRGGLGFFRPLLDMLCEVLIGRSLQEGRDHALIRLESKIRDPELPPPVKGLVTPKNCEPSFEILEKLIRKLGADTEKRNEWEEEISASWKALPFETQKERIEQLLTSTDLQVREIRGATRVVLSGNAFRNKKNAGHEIMLLEKQAKERIEPSLEFVMESLEDKNKREVR